MTDNTEQDAGLDRSLQRSVTINWEVVAWVVIIALALITRLWGLGDRAMSHDESLHTFYSWKLFDGQGYQHDPMMHGPLLFHGTALSYFLFGVSDLTARLLSAAAGVLLVSSPILVRRWMGPFGALAAGVMLLISPTIMYYSRYIRHDIPVELFTAVMFISFIRYLSTRQGKWIVLGMAAAAGTITSAEMGYINGFVLVSFIAIAMLAERMGSHRAHWVEAVFLALGLGMLGFAILANLGMLGSIDVAVEGSRARVAMQLSFLLSGLFIIYGLVSPLISRNQSVPTPPDEEADWQLIDALPFSLAERTENAASRAMRYLTSGVLVLAVGVFLIAAQSMWGSGGEGALAQSAALLGSARMLGLLLVFAGTFVALYGLAASVVRGSPRNANLVTVAVGLAPAVLLAIFWYAAGGSHLLVHGTNPNLADVAIGIPFEWLSPMAAAVLASLAVAGLGLLGGLLSVYRERGMAAAIAGASVDSIGVSIVVFAVIYTLLFTTFFTEPDRIDGFVRSIRYWLEQHDVVRGGQPWYYYSLFTPMYEFLPFFLSLVAVVVYAARRTLRFGMGNETGDTDKPSAAAWAFVPMILVWGAGNFWIYSWAGEKMPWLIVHLAVPMTFLAGRLCGDIFERVDWEEMKSRGWMLAGLTLLLLVTLGVFLGLQPFQGQTQAALSQTAGFLLALPVLLLLLWAAWRVASGMSRKQAWLAVALTLIGMMLVLNTRYSLLANFVNDELANEYIVYAHGTPDDKEVYEMLLEMQERQGIDEPLSIGYDNEVSWPFTWYFREDDWHDAQYLGEKPSGTVNQDVLLVGSPNYGAFEPYLRDRYESIEFRRMWWPNEGYKNLTPTRIREVLTSPNEMRNLLNILMYRKYAQDPAADEHVDKSLTDWYHQANMRLYVRDDLVEQMWPLLEGNPDWVSDLQSQEKQDTVSASLQIEETFESGPSGDPMVEPKGIKLGPDGTLYSVDHGQRRVLVFDPEVAGDAIEAIGEGDFVYYDADGNASSSAWGVGADDDGAVYVADTWNHQIVKYEDGTVTATVGSYGNPIEGDVTTALDLFFGPRDVALGPDGNVYITDTGNKRIVVLDKDLEPIRAFGGDGIELGQFNEPTSLAFAPDTGELFVADLWNFRIQRFDADLNPIADWTVEGWESQEAAHKAYIAVGPGGIVVASDPSGMRVWVFDSDGTPLATLDLPEDERGLDLPIGVAIDELLRIYIASSNSGLVTRYAAIDEVVEAAGLDTDDADGEDAEGEGEGEGDAEDADAEGDGEGAEGEGAEGEGDADDADADGEGADSEGAEEGAEGSDEEGAAGDADDEGAAGVDEEDAAGEDEAAGEGDADEGADQGADQGQGEGPDEDQG